MNNAPGQMETDTFVEHSRKHRYFATSIPEGEVTAAQSLALVRPHWSIEDDVFNPLDCQWEEDCNFRHMSMESALALSFLRLMALNICVMYRCRKPAGQRWGVSPSGCDGTRSSISSAGA